MTIRYLTLTDVLVLHEYAMRLLYALLRFLHVNGLELTVHDPDELYQFTLDIAGSALGQDEIAAWLRAHTTVA